MPWQQRESGYVVELAISFEAIGAEFTPSPGAVLLLKPFVYDRDDEAQNSPVSCMVLCIHSWANRYTNTYAILAFK